MAFFSLFFVLLGLLCLPGLLFGVGLLTAFAGLWALRREFSISKHGLVVPGTVIAIDARRERVRRGYATVYDAVVRFQRSEEDDPETFIVNTGSFRVYQVNQPVNVIYLLEDRTSLRIDGRMRWLGPWVLLCFGFVFAALTVILSLPQITIHH